MHLVSSIVSTTVASQSKCVTLPGLSPQTAQWAHKPSSFTGEARETLKPPAMKHRDNCSYGQIPAVAFQEAGKFTLPPTLLYRCSPLTRALARSGWLIAAAFTSFYILAMVSAHTVWIITFCLPPPLSSAKYMANEKRDPGLVVADYYRDLYRGDRC